MFHHSQVLANLSQKVNGLVWESVSVFGLICLVVEILLDSLIIDYEYLAILPVLNLFVHHVRHFFGLLRLLRLLQLLWQRRFGLAFVVF